MTRTNISGRNLGWLVHAAVAFDVWFVIGFLLYKMVLVCLRNLPKHIGKGWRDFVLQRDEWWVLLSVLSVWFVIGLLLWLWPRARKIVDDLLCDGADYALPLGSENATAMFATLAGFALAEGAALTVVAKEEGRDTLVLTIYSVAVVFSYIWTRQLLVTRPAEDKGFDKTTQLHGQFTLAWILFCGSIMFTLGCLGLLPNQEWRTPYEGSPPIEFASARDLPNSGVEWLDQMGGQSKTTTVIFTQQKTGFAASHYDIPITIRLLPQSNPKRFTAVELPHIFVASYGRGNSPTSFRKMEVQQDQSSYTATIVEPRKNDRLWILWKMTDNNKSKVVPDQVFEVTYPKPPRSTF